jgi:hypothetical protein
MKTLLPYLAFPIALAFLEDGQGIARRWAMGFLIAWAFCGLLWGTWKLAPYLPRRRGLRDYQKAGIQYTRDRAQKADPNAPRGTSHLGRRVL